MFVTNHINIITALNLISTQPTKLTGESLQILRMELDRMGFTEEQLNSAWKKLIDQEIAAADIDSLRELIGSVLVRHEQRVKDPMQKLKQKHIFSKMELDWLYLIEAYWLHETELDRKAFDRGALKNHSGFIRINIIFNNQIESLVTLYDHGGKTA